MPRIPPPGSCPSAALAGWTLRKGERIWRVHSRKVADADQFNFTPANPIAPAGRFDSDGSYGCLYAGETPETALVERFVRGPVVQDPLARYLPIAALEGKRLSELVVVEAIELLPLSTGKELSRVGQDSWLVSCEEDDYPLTYLWGLSMRQWAPIVSGFRWTSKRASPRHAVVLFSDRLESGAVVPTGDYYDLDETDGQILVLKALRRYNVTISRPGR